MRCVLIGEHKGKPQRKSVPLVPLQPTLIKENTRTLLTTDDGAVSISDVTNGVVNKTVILHSDLNHNNAIDIERQLIERTPVVEEEITFINLDSLIEKFIPESSINYTHQLISNDSEFISKLKTYVGGEHLEFTTSLKFDGLDLEVLKTKLSKFTQQISKMSHFLERDIKTSNSIGQYLSCWRNLTDKGFNRFTSSQFQPILSVSRHASILNFERCRDDVEFSNDESIQQIHDDIEYIKQKVPERASYNFKGIKIYITDKKLSINVLGYLFNDPKDSVINYVISHIMMCGQLDDFKNKLERTKLLYA